MKCNEKTVIYGMAFYCGRETQKKHRIHIRKIGKTTELRWKKNTYDWSKEYE